MPPIAWPNCRIRLLETSTGELAPLPLSPSTRTTGRSHTQLPRSEGSRLPTIFNLTRLRAVHAADRSASSFPCFLWRRHGSLSFSSMSDETSRLVETRGAITLVLLLDAGQAGGSSEILHLTSWAGGTLVLVCEPAEPRAVRNSPSWMDLIYNWGRCWLSPVGRTLLLLISPYVFPVYSCICQGAIMGNYTPCESATVEVASSDRRHRKAALLSNKNYLM